MRSCFAWLSIIGVFTSSAFAEPKSINNSGTWLQGYDNYAEHIKKTTSEERIECERLLVEILSALDAGNSCNSDSGCALINQIPFGLTVPFPSSSAESLRKQMAKYKDQCYGGGTFFVSYEDEIHQPVCVNNKCMVKTSFKPAK